MRRGIGPPKRLLLTAIRLTWSYGPTGPVKTTLVPSLEPRFSSIVGKRSTKQSR